MLFRKRAGPKPKLSQDEREAIVDLLTLCLYADADVAPKEGEFLADVVNVIGWEGGTSFSSYQGTSISGVRAARENEETKKDFLSFATARLQSKESRALAMDLCQQLSAADGSTAQTETALMGELRSALE